MVSKAPEQAISEDVNREQLRTLGAAACGLLLGIGCMVGMWHFFVLSISGGLTGQIIGVVIFLLSCWLLALQLPLWQYKFLEASSIFLSETAGYFGFIIGLPCLIFLSAAAAGPAIQLASLYSEEGRFSLATMMARMAVCISQVSP